MDRRTFIRLSSWAGLTVAATATPTVFGQASAQSRARATQAYQGPCFIFIHATGGWDPVHLCDPKGATSLEDPDRLSNYLTTDIKTAGNIAYAPVGGNEAFFTKHHQKLLVINGIDTRTNGHDSGSRHVFSGKLAEGHPSLAAMIAGHFDPALPMAYLSFGGYDLTHGITPRTRSGNVGSLSNLAYPKRSDPGNQKSNFQSDRANALIAAAQKQREASLLEQAGLPRARNTMNTMFTSRRGANDLRRLQEFLPQLDNSGNRLFRQSQLALAAYRAGICISANLSVGGFDTHNNHDATHIPRLTGLLEGIDFLWTEAERQGVADRLVVVVGSDFGRTPRYNNQNGKDHWSITSMMLMGAGIPGNRVIGLTNEGHNSIALSPTTLKPEANGIRIEPKHVHRSLRRLAGIDKGDLSTAFPIPGEDLPLW